MNAFFENKKHDKSKTMADTCLNCTHPVTENFCSNCGQKKYKRIDRKYIWDELQYTVFHTNKGLLYSVKKILRNPGKTAREYIHGIRINHYKPILLVFVLSGLATFLSFKVLDVGEIMDKYYTQNHIKSKMMGDLMSFISGYYSVIMLLLVPLFALTTKIAFRKWGQNYYEHIVMNAYILSFYTLATIIIIYPAMFFFRHKPDVSFELSQTSILLVPFILIWFFKEFYKGKPLKAILLRVFGALAMAFIGYLVLIAILGGAILMSKGPEALEYMKPQ